MSVDKKIGRKKAVLGVVPLVVILPKLRKFSKGSAQRF